MDVLDAVYNRRSVRSYLEKPLEEEKLVKILDAGRWAPSAGNVQEWRFIVVKSHGTRLQVAEACLGQFWIAQAPVIVVICAKLDAIGNIYGETGKNFFSILDCGLAAQNIMLMAHSLGVGSCAVASFEEESLKRILAVPDGIKPVVAITLGYPMEKPKAPYRKDLESIVFFEKYGKTWVKDVSNSINTPVFLRRDQV